MSTQSSRRLFIALTCLAMASSFAVAADHFVEGELLVKFQGGPKGNLAKAARANLRHEVKRDFDFIGWQHIRLPRAMTVEDALRRYRDMPGVIAVEPNLVQVFGDPADVTSTNDPLFSQQYSLGRISVTNAWGVTIGNSNVVVAVMDSGIRFNHEDLEANLWRNPGEIPGNGIDDDANGYVDDVHGIDTANDFYGRDGNPFDEGIDIGGGMTVHHGTHCAGIIGALANNGRGIAGMAWNVQLLSLRVLATNNTADFAELIEALEYAVTMKQRGVNIRVINMSLSGTNFSEAGEDAHRAAAAAGILQVGSAGNDALDNDVVPRYPNSLPIDEMIAVAASDQNDALATFSCYGRTNADLAAPGVSIQVPGGPATNFYRFANGTSFSCPIVVGAAALLFSAYPSATPLEVKAALIDSVDKLPAFTNKMVSNGRLNVGRAMQLLGERLTNAPPNITFQPEGQTIVVSNGFDLRAVATGTQPLDFQWWLNGAVVNGATNLTHKQLAAAEGDAGEYTLVVSNAFGVVTSAVARVTVLTMPVLVTQPQTRAAPETSNVTFTATAAGYLPRYHWQFFGTNLPGRTGTNLALTNITPALEGPYSVVVSNGYGMTTSAVATLTVWTFPRIVEPTEPVRFSVVRGESVTLSVRTTGSLPINYRWRRVGLGVVLTNMVLNDHQSFFTFVPTNSGTYTLVLTNAAQPFSNSQRTNAIVTLLEDSDGDGLPDNWEAQYIGVAEPDSDVDGDGLTNLQEYRAGTDPTDATSALRIESLTRDGPETRLSFKAASNKTYTVEQRAFVHTGAWERVLNVVAAPADRQIDVVRTNDLANPHNFYRVRAPVP